MELRERAGVMAGTKGLTGGPKLSAAGNGRTATREAREAAADWWGARVKEPCHWQAGPGSGVRGARERAEEARAKSGRGALGRAAWGRLGLGGNGPCGGGGEAGRAQVKEGSGPRQEDGPDGESEENGPAGEVGAGWAA